MNAPLAEGSLPRTMLLIAIVIALLVATARVIRLKQDDEAVIVGLLAGDRETEIGHALMLSAMALMLTLTSAPQSVWLWTFGFLTAHYLWRLVEHSRALNAAADSARARARIGGVGYHALGAFAMLYSALGEPAERAGSGHSHMASMSMSHGGSPPAHWFGWLLVGLFAVDAIATVAVAALPRAFNLPGLAAEDRIGTAPHIVMDIGMAMMVAAAL